MTSLKRVASLRAGGTPSVDDPIMWSESEEDGLAWVSIGDMSDGRPVTTTARRVSERGVASKRLPIGEPGTLLFAMYASVGAVGRLETRATWNQALLGIVPRSGQSDGRFIRYWLEHLRPSLGGLIRSNTQDNLNAEQVGNFPFSDMPMAEQRAIADYLDAETARIDALVAKKQQLIRLLEERRDRSLDDELARRGVVLPDSLEPTLLRSLALPPGWKAAKLSSALEQLTNGFVGPTRDILRDDGIRYIQGLHIKRGRIDFSRRPFYVSRVWHQARPRTSLRPGDVVIVQTGDIAQCAVVPQGFGEANCHALLIARVNRHMASGEYLAAFLQSAFGRNSLLRLATGALHPHLEFGIRDAPVLLPPKELQAEISHRVHNTQQEIDAAVAATKRQIELLAEHRQALITAAVTGEFTVPGAA